MSASRPGRVPRSSARGREAPCRPAASRPRQRGSPRRDGRVLPPGSACQSVQRPHSAHPPLAPDAPGSSPDEAAPATLRELGDKTGSQVKQNRGEGRSSKVRHSERRRAPSRAPRTALHSRGPSSKSGPPRRLREVRPELGRSGLGLEPHRAGAIGLDSGNRTGRGSGCHHPPYRSLGLAHHRDTYS